MFVVRDTGTPGAGGLRLARAGRGPRNVQVEPGGLPVEFDLFDSERASQGPAGAPAGALWID
jgi:hypothetical protein